MMAQQASSTGSSSSLPWATLSPYDDPDAGGAAAAGATSLEDETVEAVLAAVLRGEGPDPALIAKCNALLRSERGRWSFGNHLARHVRHAASLPGTAAPLQRLNATDAVRMTGLQLVLQVTDLGAFAALAALVNAVLLEAEVWSDHRLSRTLLVSCARIAGPAGESLLDTDPVRSCGTWGDMDFWRETTPVRAGAHFPSHAGGAAARGGSGGGGGLAAATAAGAGPGGSGPALSGVAHAALAEAALMRRVGVSTERVRTFAATSAEAAGASRVEALEIKRRAGRM
jgi:hypothetical protein